MSFKNIPLFFIATFWSIYLPATVYTVTTTADSGPGSLRDAITTADLTAGPHTINFNIGAGELQTISLSTPLPQITSANGVVIDATTQPGWSPAKTPIININGPGYNEGIYFNGAANSALYGVVIYNIGDPGVRVNNSAGTIIRNCYIGVAAVGNAAAPGPTYGNCIYITLSPNCIVGGNLVSNPEYKNVLSNHAMGIRIETNSTGCQIKGNYIAVNETGTAAISNSSTGIYIAGASHFTVIGGSAAGDGNIIGTTTGNDGIYISASNSDTIKGNYVGTDATGSISFAIARNALYISNSNNNVIGGTSSTEKNIFSSATGQDGILFDAGSTGNVVYGNMIGTDLNGTLDFGNGRNGVRFESAPTNTVGGTTSGMRNIISGNDQEGVVMVGSTNIQIIGNYIGLNAAGTGAIGNGTNSNHHGVKVDGSANATINSNVIGNHFGNGIDISNSASGSTIKGNCIGTDATGLTMMRNRNHGIQIIGSNTHTIGGSAAGDRNIISGNGDGAGGTDGDGIHLENVSNCTIQGNYIGVDATGNSCLGNDYNGIYIKDAGGGASSNTIGGTNAGEGNVVGCNGMGLFRHGIQFDAADNNFVYGNYFGLGANGTSNVGNAQDGISLYNGANGNTIGGNSAAYRNISSNNTWGIFVQVNSNNNLILGNYLGTDVTGTLNKGNGISNSTEGGGVGLQTGSSGNYVGRAASGEGNLILYNKVGIHLRGDPGGATGSFIYNNIIKYSVRGTYTKFASYNYSGAGIIASGGSNQNKIGEITNPYQPNTISNNEHVGIIVDASDQVEIRRNSIFCNGANSSEKSNEAFAILLLNSANNGVTPPGPLTTPVMTSATGITESNTPSGGAIGSDIIEVFYDEDCGCQAKTFLGTAAINAGSGQWSYLPPGNPTNIPASLYCSPGSSLTGGGTCPPTGLSSVTATRTQTTLAPGRTSQLMSCEPLILPVSLISFSVKKSVSNSVLLSWSTASEKNNSYFEILRSTDGSTFVPIGLVEGSGTSIHLNNYSFNDEGLMSGKYYYMLNQVDYNGKGHLSPISVISMKDGMKIDVLSTTVAMGENIKVVNFSENKIESIVIMDVSGKVVSLENNITSTPELSTKGFSTGIYLVKINTGGQVIVKKVMVY